MSIAVGTKLGPYEILGAAGAGGMGEVYRARDTRLDRTVAIKVLSAKLVDRPDLHRRFEREARTISKLTHPHICALYDVGQQEGVGFLVMEYLEGETLGHRLQRGPLAPEQTLKYGIEIAAALETAHRQGIVHRDLKPANVMLTKAGAKLMDFGLAKLAEQPAPVAVALSEMADAPTLPSQEKSLTEEGVIVGTFQYMAPEQLEGKDADARTDLFALGMVLYEMATGRPAFIGKTKASVIAAILSSEPPPISTLQPLTLPAFERVVKTCLAKDPEDRFSTAHDLKLELKWIAEGGSQAGAPAPVAAQRRNRERLAWAMAAICVLLMLAAAYTAYERSGQPAQPIYSSLLAAEGSRLAFTGDRAGPPVINPDGTQIAYLARDRDNKLMLWLRRLDSMAAQPLSGTEDARFPFWSADGRVLGFFAEGKLKAISVNDGSVITLCAAQNGRGGAWSRDGVILFSPDFRAGLMRVPSSGGAPADVLKLEGNAYSSYRWPAFLPDGKHFLYLAVKHEKEPGERDALYFASLDGKENRRVMETGFAALYASGYLLFMREHALLAQRFDPATGTLSGEAVPLAQKVVADLGLWRAIFDASANGTLIYQADESSAADKAAWYDRNGRRLSDLAIPGGYQSLRISPDGRSVAVQASLPASDIWNYDLARGTRTRITFDSNPHGSPVWSPDGKWIAYETRYSDKRFAIARKPADGTGTEEILLESGSTVTPTDWSPDGRHLLFENVYVRFRRSDISELPLAGDRKPVSLVQSPFSNGRSRFSPDGKWFVYDSNESGRPEVYVAPFPGPGGKWQISVEGGFIPVWLRNGKEILFQGLDAQIHSVTVSISGNQVRAGEPKVLFPYPGSPIDPYFGPTPDGQRLLIGALTEESQAPVTLVLNWRSLLKR